VPARGVFEVMSVRAVQADQRFIEVGFSSSLKPGRASTDSCGSRS